MNPESLYDEYGEKLFSYLVFKLGSAHDAEDVLQELFCRFSRYRVRWALVRDPRAFVFRAAKNEANRWLRKRADRFKGEIMNPGWQEVFAGPETEGAESDARRALDLLSALPDEQREVVFLKIYEDLTFREIASVCGIPADTAASRYRYALAKLRASLEKRP